MAAASATLNVDPIGASWTDSKGLPASGFWQPPVQAAKLVAHRDERKIRDNCDLWPLDQYLLPLISSIRFAKLSGFAASKSQSMLPTSGGKNCCFSFSHALANCSSHWSTTAHRARSRQREPTLNPYVEPANHEVPLMGNHDSRACPQVLV